MPSSLRASGLRYRDYRRKLKLRAKSKEASSGGHSSANGDGHGSAEHKKHKPRSRSFLRLLVAFWGMLRGYQRTIVLVLVAAAISTILGLVPLYGTKIVFDSVLREQPLSPHVPAWLHVPHEPRRL